ncbi:MAG TPA: hypothetical protein VEC35_19140 [Noviherbaspirillum sp.]|nr:hypothetical protein [Noviherbaspirillum sp.]
MHELRSQIDHALAMLEDRTLAEPRRSALSRLASGAKGKMREGLAWMLFRPTEPEPNLEGAMRTPLSARETRRLRSGRSGQPTSAPPADNTGAQYRKAALLLEAAGKLRHRAQRDEELVHDGASSAPPAIAYAARDNLQAAQELEQRAQAQVQAQEANMARTAAYAVAIRELKGFAADTGDDACDELRQHLTAFVERPGVLLDDIQNALDRDTAFRLLYLTLAVTLAPPGEDADPARAAAVLKELTRPLFDLADLMSDDGPAPLAGRNDAVVEDARRVVRELAGLRHGTEILRRLLWSGLSEAAAPRGLSRHEQAIKVFFLADKALAEKGSAVNASTERLLQAARCAARKVVENPEAALTDAEHVAYAAVRNRFIESGNGSTLHEAADRLSTVAEKWVPLAAGSTAGSHSPDGGESPFRLRRALGDRVNTPLHRKTLELASGASTAYGMDLPKAIAQIDETILNAADALKAAVIALARSSPGTLPEPLLLHVAACDVAREDIASRGIRPEHGAVCVDDDASGLERIRRKLHKINEEEALGLSDAVISRLSASQPELRPDILSAPLKGESLFAAKDMLVATAGPAGTILHPVTERALSEIRRLEHLFDLSAPDIQSAEDIYRYLTVKMEQFQLRGRLRLISGAVTGLNIRPVSYSVKGLDSLSFAYQLVRTNGLSAVSISPRLRLEKQAGDNAVFELSMSTLGFEIFIGQEKRVHSTVGSGVSVGAGNAVAVGQVLLDKMRARERVVQDGVKLMIPRSPTKEYSDDEMRREARVLLDLTLRMFVAGDGGVHRMKADHFMDGSDVAGVPNALAAILKQCPHVSIAVVDEMRENRVRREFSAGLGARLTLSGAGLMPSGGARKMRATRAGTVVEQSGVVNIERLNLFAGRQTSLIRGVSPFGTIVSEPSASVQQVFRLGTVGIAGQSQRRIAGNDARLRLVRVDGKTDAANTRCEIEHTTAAALVQSIRSRYDDWVQLGMEKLFSTPEYAVHKDAPLSEKWRMVSEHLAATLKELEGQEQAADGTRVVRHVFNESHRITDSAAVSYDALCDEQALTETRIRKLEDCLHGQDSSGAATPSQRSTLKLQVREAQQSRENLLEAQHAVLVDASSSTPWEITAVERTLESSQVGIDFFLRMGATNIAEGQRPVKSWPT